MRVKLLSWWGLEVNPKIKTCLLTVLIPQLVAAELRLWLKTPPVTRPLETEKVCVVVTSYFTELRV